MAHVSPLRERHLQAEATMLPYGPLELGVELVESFGELDFEYAALRKACVLLDQPHRGTIEIVGDDRLPFLNNMVTQELKGLTPCRAVRSFWLNRKGRIEADLRVIELGGRMLVDLDAHAVDRTIESLGSYVIADDVEIRDASDRMHRLALHGPTAIPLLAAIAEHNDDAGPPVSDLTPGAATVLRIAGREVVVDRWDSAGEAGLELTVAADDAPAVYAALIDAGQPHLNGESNGSGSGSTLAERIKLRPAGWLAYNTARIEAGTPLFNVDFSTDSLPAETGRATLADRVSFTKGCYLGQEVVARMHSLGKPKQTLVGLKPAGPDLRDEQGFCRQPVGGAPVFAASDPTGDAVGAVTSSTVSPMLGGEPVCFAIVKARHAEEGTPLVVPAEGVRLTAPVRTDLTFYARG